MAFCHASTAALLGHAEPDSALAGLRAGPLIKHFDAIGHLPNENRGVIAVGIVGVSAVDKGGDGGSLRNTLAGVKDVINLVALLPKRRRWRAGQFLHQGHALAVSDDFKLFHGFRACDIRHDELEGSC
jgi:hypothetical protein